MTKKSKLAVEMSEKRQALNTLLGKDELTVDERETMSALTTRLQEIEPELRACIVEEETREIRTEGTTEGRELRELVDRASLGAIFAAVLEHRMTEGAERELQDHLGLAGNQIPLALLEMRATGVTPAPADVGQNQSTIIPGRVSAVSCAAYLGVDMPRVGVGDAVFPVLTVFGRRRRAGRECRAGRNGGGVHRRRARSRPHSSQLPLFSREDRARFMGMDSPRCVRT